MYLPVEKQKKTQVRYVVDVSKKEKKRKPNVLRGIFRSTNKYCNIFMFVDQRFTVRRSLCIISHRFNVIIKLISCTN